jgi:methylated-DNA-[protein]-cysteine S-methyltransferase
MPAHVLDTPIGPLTLVATDEGLHEIHFPGRRGKTGGRSPDGQRTASPDRPTHAVLAATVDQLEEYFAGQRQVFDLPLAPAGTPFQLTAWRALCAIPYADTVSYGEQARRLGGADKSRAVGAANGQNPIPIVIPCHRVVGADGKLVGFGGGLETKAWLLDHERRTAGAILDLG